MQSNRRKFLQYSGLTGIAFTISDMVKAFGQGIPEKSFAEINHFPKNGAGDFNMCGYAAPKLETVRVGFIGLGSRGSGAAPRMKHIQGVEIIALCDIIPEKVNVVKKGLEGSSHHPVEYTKNQDDWKKLCERPDIDLVYIATPWSLHTPMATYAMTHGKHVCVEVPVATTIEECWQLVETSEKTRKHCMMLENCCYDFFELLTLNLARQGFFGEIIHGEGGYIHDRSKSIFDKKSTTWRLEENMRRNGNLYPTHGLGPICQVMNINRGDKLEFLVSTSSNDFTYGIGINKLAESDDFWKPYAHKSYRGNMNTTTIRTALGRTIMLQHDTSSPRVYTRIHMISGTKGSALKYPLPGKLARGHENWLSSMEYKEMENKYEPPIVKRVGEMAKQVGGHGGMDFIMDWRTIDCLRNGLPLDQDVYDAALWSSVGPLSEWSVAHRSDSIDIPDFTRGSWKTNKIMDITLDNGGTTKVMM